jgi:Tfp pilus assembly PilM family ATPase
VTSPEVQRYISDALQLPADSIFPFAQIGYPAFMEDVLRELGPTFSVALGGALRPLLEQ